MTMFDFLVLLIEIVVIYVSFLTVVPVMSWVERRGAGLIQDRPGPNRVGPMGLFQPIADFLKFIFKEDPIPHNVNPFLYTIGPFVALMPASLVIAAIPIGDFFVINGKEYLLQIADIDVGLLYVLAIGSLGVYGIMFGGWASNNKFSLLGAMRASSQMISYEIPMGLAASAAVAVYGTFSLREIALTQQGTIMGVLPKWGIIAQPLGFFVFLIAAFAETNRLPFDLPETEAELVGGFHTEYGSMHLAVYLMAEYVHLTVACAMMTTLYFGAWHLPWIWDQTILEWVGGSQNWLAVIQVLIWCFKVTLLLLFFVWVRWTVPRFRFDQLMRVAWKNLIPLGVFNLVATAILLYFREVA